MVPTPLIFFESSPPCTMNIELWELVVTGDSLLPLLSPILFSNQFEPSRKFTNLVQRILSSEILFSTIRAIGLRGAMRAIVSLGCKGAMRASASSIAPIVSPRQAGPHNDILCRSRGRHNNCSNLHQRRREDSSNDPTRENLNRRKGKGLLYR
jgi:hypothetical protein